MTGFCGMRKTTTSLMRTEQKLNKNSNWIELWLMFGQRYLSSNRKRPRTLSVELMWSTAEQTKNMLTRSRQCPLARLIYSETFNRFIGAWIRADYSLPFVNLKIYFPEKTLIVICRDSLTIRMISVLVLHFIQKSLSIQIEKHLCRWQMR